MNIFKRVVRFLFQYLKYFGGSQ